MASMTSAAHKHDTRFTKLVDDAAIYDLAKETALNKLVKLSKQLSRNIYIKREDTQPIHSFKLRGAYYKLLSLQTESEQRGVIAASAGNHAQGVALAAQHLGIKATIVMPITTPDIKVDAVKSYGAHVILHGIQFDQALSEALRLSEQLDAHFIPPFDDESVIIGQATVAKELAQELCENSIIFVPVGGGGLLAGIARYIKEKQIPCRIIGVEANDSACLQAALAAGKPVAIDSVGIFADGVAVKQIGHYCFKDIQRYCDAVITVNTDEICAAIKDIFDDTRAISEPAGALALAGLKKYCQTNQETHNQCIAILSGANLNFHSLRYVSECTEIAEQREAVLAVNIEEEKGSFRRFCNIIAGRAITEFNYRYASDVKATIYVGLKLSKGLAELQQITQELSNQSYQYVDLSNNELAKLHGRHLVGGKPSRKIPEKLFRFQFPEHPGALLRFLDTFGDRWNISLFHYRNHGAAIGHVLAGFEVEPSAEMAFRRHLKALGYPHQEETNNPCYQLFLKSN